MDGTRGLPLKPCPILDKVVWRDADEFEAICNACPNRVDQKAKPQQIDDNRLQAIIEELSGNQLTDIIPIPDSAEVAINAGQFRRMRDDMYLLAIELKALRQNRTLVRCNHAGFSGCPVPGCHHGIPHEPTGVCNSTCYWESLKYRKDVSCVPVEGKGISQIELLETLTQQEKSLAEASKRYDTLIGVLHKTETAWKLMFEDMKRIKDLFEFPKTATCVGEIEEAKRIAKAAIDRSKG